VLLLLCYAVGGKVVGFGAYSRLIRVGGTYTAEKTGGKVKLIDGTVHYPETKVPGKTASILIDFISQS
jgi:hypothetical protein